jgi:hypothetical protein
MGNQVNATIVDPTTGENIKPVIASDLATLATAAEQVALADNLAANSDGGGILVLTISGNVAVGTDQDCRSVLLHTDAADVTMLIDSTGAAAADANDFLLLQSTLMPVPVKNLKHLRFYGATDTAKVYILYRN